MMEILIELSKLKVQDKTFPNYCSKIRSNKSSSRQQLQLTPYSIYYNNETNRFAYTVYSSFIITLITRNTQRYTIQIILLYIISFMPLPSSSELWKHVSAAKGQAIKAVGGNVAEQVNFCAIRLSYALIKCGHPIKRTSDFYDANKNKYIIRAQTMQAYLNEYYKKSQLIQSIKGLSGIVYFQQCGFGDATGHVDVIVNGQVADKDFSHLAKRIVYWKC